MEYHVRVMTNTVDKGIDDYVIDHGTLYHLSIWSEVIKNVFDHDTFYFYAVDSGNKVCGVLPLAYLKSNLFGQYLVSMPYFNYGGVIADSDSIGALLVEKAIEHAKELDAEHIEFRCTEKMIALPCRENKVNMILDLPEDVESLERSIGSKKRSQVRRPIKEGVEVVRGGLDLVDDFYSVFAENMRDLGTPVYSKDLFIEVLKKFPDKTQIIILRKNNEPISGAFLIGFKDKLEIPWASTLRRYNAFSPNMLLYWEVLKYAIEEKYKQFDFGRSSIDSGTYKFKKQWGARPLQLYWHYWLKDQKEIPIINPDNPKYKLAINIWKRLPLFLANYIGPKIVKNLP